MEYRALYSMSRTKYETLLISVAPFFNLCPNNTHMSGILTGFFVRPSDESRSIYAAGIGEKRSDCIDVPLAIRINNVIGTN